MGFLHTCSWAVTLFEYYVELHCVIFDSSTYFLNDVSPCRQTYQMINMLNNSVWSVVDRLVVSMHQASLWKTNPYHLSRRAHSVWRPNKRARNIDVIRPSRLQFCSRILRFIYCGSLCCTPASAWRRSGRVNRWDWLSETTMRSLTHAALNLLTCTALSAAVDCEMSARP